MDMKTTLEQDRLEMEKTISNVPDTKSVAHFKPSTEIRKLPLKFDIEKLRQAVDGLSEGKGLIDLRSGFQATTLTQRPGVSVVSDNDLSGRFGVVGIPTWCFMKNRCDVLCLPIMKNIFHVVGAIFFTFNQC